LLFFHIIFYRQPSVLESFVLSALGALGALGAKCF